MERSFEIEWPGLKICLTATCLGAELTVGDVTGDGSESALPQTICQEDVKLRSKAPAELTLEDCLGVAARCWCDPVYEQVAMDVAKAKLIAKLLFAAVQTTPTQIPDDAS